MKTFLYQVLVFCGLLLPTNSLAQDYFWGDVTHDGAITQSDVTQIVQIILGNQEKEIITLPGIEGNKYWADTNHDGVVDISDITEAVLIANNLKSAERIIDKTNTIITVAGHDCVDLGLKDNNGKRILWATCNIGATKPQEFGMYYAWGETKEKKNYTWENYSFASGSTESVDNLSRYNATTSRFLNLLYEDDIAQRSWGEGWSMPNSEELKKLITQCKWIWQNSENTEFNGVCGYKVIGPNENYIFIPAAGRKRSTSTIEENEVVAFWTNEISNNETNAYLLYKDKNNATIDVDIASRILGCPIRPVFSTKEADPKCLLDGYTMAWHDEFNTYGLPDEKHWICMNLPAGHTNDELQEYHGSISPMGDTIALVSKGNLNIKCVFENGKVYSARLHADFEKGWQYGYMEASIKLPGGYGTWPAFWMMDVDHEKHKKLLDGRWPKTGEIDIMENVGKAPNTNQCTVQYTEGGNNAQRNIRTNHKGLTTSFHKYAMEWKEGYIAFYIDDKLTLECDPSNTNCDVWPYEYPFYIILNVAFGGAWGAGDWGTGTQGKVDYDCLPRTMEVDYVRVYQKDPTTAKNPMDSVDSGDSDAPDAPETPDSPESPETPDSPDEPETPQSPVTGNAHVFLLENNQMYRYLRDFEYDANDYSYSKIADYCDLTNTKKHQDWPSPVTLGEATYYNLIPGQTYQLDSVSNGQHFPIEIKTIGRIRTIKTDGLDNVRDFGGWKTSDGKQIKYGLLFRGTEMDTKHSSATLSAVNSPHKLSENDRKLLKETLGIKAELDLRASSETDRASALGSDCKYLYTPILARRDNFNSPENKSELAWCLRFIISQLRDHNPIYIHSVWGADRAGLMSTLILGVLGVSNSDLDKESELSSFANHIRYRYYETDSRNYSTQYLIEDVKRFKGSTLQEQFVNWWKEAGISETDILQLKEFLLCPQVEDDDLILPDNPTPVDPTPIDPNPEDPKPDKPDQPGTDDPEQPGTETPGTDDPDDTEEPGIDNPDDSGTEDPDDTDKPGSEDPDSPEDPTPEDTSDYEDPNHPSVDLGLVNSKGERVLWATTNIGAVNPYDFGEYYSWGEVSTKTTYTWDTYKWRDKDGHIKKYNSSDNRMLLDYDDDVATQQWGERWHIPSDEDFDLIRANCTTTWINAGNKEYNGVAGVKITGPNGNSIFLPGAGFYYDGNSLSNKGDYALYWSNSRNSVYEEAYTFGYSAKGLSNTKSVKRSQGRSIRPVRVTSNSPAPPIPDTPTQNNPDNQDDPDNPSDHPSNDDPDENGTDQPGTENPDETESPEDQTPDTPEEKTPTTHPYVDLGQTNADGHPVLWATYNVGTNEEHPYGNLYAWGETESKSEYYWYNYTMGNENALTKYNFLDKRLLLEPNDDVATQLWGDEWHTPTADDILFLETRCAFSWISAGNTEYNGTIGVKITGPNGNSIFLPAAGYQDGANTTQKDVYGIYWSSSLSPSNQNMARIFAYSDTKKLSTDGYANRYQARSIRPVRIDYETIRPIDTPDKPDKPEPVIPEVDPAPVQPENTFLLENDRVYHFVRDFQYTSDYSYTKLPEFCDTTYTIGKHQDWPRGVTLGEATYYNLVPGRIYKLKRVEKGKQTEVTIKTTGQVRTIKMEGIDNVRDLGGWASSINGKHVRYERLYRGTELTTNQKDIHYLDSIGSRHEITNNDRKVLLETMGVRAELDFRAYDEKPNNFKRSSALGSDIAYHECYLDYHDIVFNYPDNKERLRLAFQFVLKELREDKAVYFHCVWGSDRTGIFSAMILGLLGVSNSDIDKEFELSSFSNHLRLRYKCDKHKFATQYLIQEVKHQTGATLADKFKNWWLTTGVTEDEIEEFRMLMLE